MVTFRSDSWASNSMTNLSTTRATTPGLNAEKEMTASSRLRNSGVKSRLMASWSSPVRGSLVKPMAGFAISAAPGVGGHNQDDVAEIDGFTIVIGQLSVIHHLQEDVEEIRMRLLDLVEQEHAVRVLIHGIGQESSLIEAHIAWWSADQPRDRMPLHVLRHVKAGEFNTQRTR